MQHIRILAIAALALIVLAAGRDAHAAEQRLALVIGEAAYPAKPIATAANDAGLIAQTLQAAGFDVTGARDLEEAAVKQALRDFLDKTAAAGPDAVAFIYVSGYGLQLEGENYIVPVDAKIARDSDLPLRALRVSDYLKPLAASPAKLAIVVLDIARANPFALAGQPLAGGLALYEPGGRTLLAYNAAPGTIAPESTGDYGPYAHALAEMIRDGGQPLMDVFDTTRLRVSELTKGAQIPWNSQRVETDFVFFQREANAPKRADDAARLAQPISALGPEDGFSAALRRDTLQGYEDYVGTYPAAPLARRARAILAARREALTWRGSRIMDTPNAYWSYLRRYPKGPHAWDARGRLAELRDALEPPPEFEMVDYGYPPPSPDELIYVEQPVVYFNNPAWGFAPPPPPPVWFLPPTPPNFIILPPPVAIATPYVLPAPAFVPIPIWQAPPPYVAPPPQNFIYANMHKAVMVTPGANEIVIRDPVGGAVSTQALNAAGAAVGGAAMGVGAVLPHFISNRKSVTPRPGGGDSGVMTPGMPPVTPTGAPIGGPAPGETQPAPGAETRPGLVAPQVPGAARPLPGGGLSTPPGEHPAAAGLHSDYEGLGPTTRPAGPGLSKEHALPTPAEGDVSPTVRPARPGPSKNQPLPTQSEGAVAPTAHPAPGRDHAPLAASRLDGRVPARERPAGQPGDEELAPAAPMGVTGGLRPAPTGNHTSGPGVPPSEARPPSNTRSPSGFPSLRFDGGPDAPGGRGVGGKSDAPMGGPGALLPQMRDPYATPQERAPARVSPRGMDGPSPGIPPQMRGMPRDVMPGGSPPMPATPHNPSAPEGAAQQMRQMAPPPGAMRSATPFPQAAPQLQRSEDAPQHGSGGGGAKFGGPAGFGGLR